MSINKMGNYPIFDSPTSVYKLNGFSLQELLSEFWEKIQDCIDDVNIAMDFMRWIKEEGLPLEVQKEIEKMYQDGRLADIINVTLFDELELKVETNKTEIIKLKEFLNYMPVDGGDFIDGNNPPTNPIIDGGSFDYAKVKRINLRSVR